MTPNDPGVLRRALEERARSLARARERLAALEAPAVDHVVAEPDPDAVLQSALDALAGEDAYDTARRLVAGEKVESGDALARAGLAVWDPSTDSFRPTDLLVELVSAGR